MAIEIKNKQAPRASKGDLNSSLSSGNAARINGLQEISNAKSSQTLKLGDYATPTILSGSSRF